MKIINILRNFIYRLFNKTKSLPEGQFETVSPTPTNSYNSFIDSLQAPIKNYSLQTQILNEIDKNPNLIYKLSYQRLVQLNQIYETRIKELEKRLSI